MSNRRRSEFSPDGTLVAIVDFGRSLHVLRSDDLEPVNEPGQLEHGGGLDPLGPERRVTQHRRARAPHHRLVDRDVDRHPTSPSSSRWTTCGPQHSHPTDNWSPVEPSAADVVLWDAETGALLSAPIPVHDGIIYRLDWSADGVRVATSSLDRTIRVTDVGSESVVAELIGHQEGILWVEWSPQGDRLVSTGFDGSVRIWDAVTLAQQGDALVAHSNSTSMVRWADDGDVIASASDDRSVLGVGRPRPGDRLEDGARRVQRDVVVGQLVLGRASIGCDRSVRERRRPNWPPWR